MSVWPRITVCTVLCSAVLRAALFEIALFSHYALLCVMMLACQMCRLPPHHEAVRQVIFTEYPGSAGTKTHGLGSISASQLRLYSMS